MEVSSRGFAAVGSAVEVSSRGFAAVGSAVEVSSRGFSRPAAGAKVERFGKGGVPPFSDCSDDVIQPPK